MLALTRPPSRRPPPRLPLLAVRPAVPAARAGGSGPAAAHPAAGLLRDIAALSADSMGGRGPGTAGDRMARGYLARRLQEIGFAARRRGRLVGAAHPVRRPDAAGTSAAWRFAGPGGEAAFRWRDDFIGGSGVQAPRVAIDDAEVVFVGYGIQAPEYQWDDFKGADLKGKVLLMLNNDPDWDPTLFAGTKRLYYGRWDYKYESAARQGAAGAPSSLHTDAVGRLRWNVVQRSWSGTQFELPAGRRAAARSSRAG